MIARTLAASILALGLLTPVAFAAEQNANGYNTGCSMDQTRDRDFIDCNVDTSNQSFAAPYTGPMNGEYGLEGSSQGKAGVGTPSAQ